MSTASSGIRKTKAIQQKSSSGFTALSSYWRCPPQGRGSFLNCAFSQALSPSLRQFYVALCHGHRCFSSAQDGCCNIDSMTLKKQCGRYARSVRPGGATATTSFGSSERNTALL